MKVGPLEFPEQLNSNNPSVSLESLDVLPCQLPLNRKSSLKHCTHDSNLSSPRLAEFYQAPLGNVYDHFLSADKKSFAALVLIPRCQSCLCSQKH